MSYDVNSVTGEPLLPIKVSKHKLITTGAKSPFNKKQKKTAVVVQRKTIQEMEALLNSAYVDLGWLEKEKTVRTLTAEEEQQIIEAKRYITQYADYKRHIANRPFRDARPKRIQRLAAYNDNPEPYEGREGTVSEAEGTPPSV